MITVILPTLGWAWPALAPILGATAAALGYKTFAEPQGSLRGRLTRELEQMRTVRVSLDAVLSEVIAEEIGTEERLRFERDDLILVFRKDARGKFIIDVLGPREKPALDLQIRGEEFARELVRKFAYHRLVTQLLRVGAVIVEERIEANGRIHLQASRWQVEREEFTIRIEPDGRIAFESQSTNTQSFQRIVEFLEATVGRIEPDTMEDPPELRIDLKYQAHAAAEEHVEIGGD